MIGHEWAVDLLKEHIIRNQVRHAYLFCGPQGVGRRTLALRFAQSLNCMDRPAPGDSCQECRICNLTYRMVHPDLAVVQAEREGGTIKVDQVRELQYMLALHPYDARYRVAILLRFEEANQNAMNALLKTLEEPASHVVLILTAESAESLLPTIVSRCEVLRLRPLPIDQVDQGLQAHWEVPAEKAQFLAHISGGRPGYALRLYQEPGFLERREGWLNDHSKLLTAVRVERFLYAEKHSKDKDALREMLSVWLSVWRDVLLKAAGTDTPIINLDRKEEIERLSSKYGLRIGHNMTSAIERTLAQLERNVNVRLAAEVLMLDLPTE